MKSLYKISVCILLLFVAVNSFAQHQTKMNVTVNFETKTLKIQQEIEFYNQSNDTLNTIVLNDWNNAFSNKNSPLSQRFSDEFYNGFQFAKEEERGITFDINIYNNNSNLLSWDRNPIVPDVIVLNLDKPLFPNQKTVLHLNYSVKIPSAKFTEYGYDNDGNLNLKNWYLTPARYENRTFIQYNNYNLDDIANAVSDYNIEIKVPNTIKVITDLDQKLDNQDNQFSTYNLTGKNWTDFSLLLQQYSNFDTYKTNTVAVVSNLTEKKVTQEEKNKAINQIVAFTNREIGAFSHDKIVVSQIEYNRNPFYGLNQLPSFIRPFSNEFIFELMFLKTYLNEYLKKSLKLDPRKDHWIYDGIQIYTMMKYIQMYYPDYKMYGNTNKYFFLKTYSMANVDFNEQYSYFYLMMARKNLDQPLEISKDSLIKFNEKIAIKYRAGLSLKYLDSYLENNKVNNSIQQFYYDNKVGQVTSNDFSTILKTNANQNIDWFFDIIVNSRELIDYKVTEVSKTKDSLTYSLKNLTGVKVPIPVYGIKKKEIVFKKWLDINQVDSTFTINRKEADKIVVNYKNEVPEINTSNNTFSVNNNIFNRPIKFNLMKDLEDPKYNQVLWVPEFGYNYYDGLILAVSFHNKAFLEKKFNYQITPSYSVKSNSLTGSTSLVFNQNLRENNSKLYNITYSTNTSYYFYAPDASYLRLNPSVLFRFRDNDFRNNRNQLLLVREVIVDKEPSAVIVDSTEQSYAVFDVKYFDTKFEGLNHYKFVNDLQLSKTFGKISTEIGYRKIYNNNRQLTLRLFAGAFLYNNSDSDYFSFATDRPTDYLFDYSYLGRSQSTGIFSQQYIVAEGGFKSMLDIPYANRWITAFNANYTIWNWIEAYGDLGFVKNNSQTSQFIYDSGICFDLINNYFELYFPVYSNNGWEIAQPHYSEKIRFIITLNPKILFTLFTRKWF